MALRNSCGIPVVFEVIQNFYKTYLQIQPMKGKILPKDVRSLNFSFMCKEEMQNPDWHELTIKIRGGAPIKLDFFAKTSIPKVRIAQPEFNFGDIRFGNTGTL